MNLCVRVTKASFVPLRTSMAISYTLIEFAIVQQAGKIDIVWRKTKLVVVFTTNNIGIRGGGGSLCAATISRE